MDYKHISYFAKERNISERRIRTLCSEGRIDGAIRLGKTWLIPINSVKPIDKRFKNDNQLFFQHVNFKTIDDKKVLIDSCRPFSNNIVKQLKDKIVIEWTYNSNAIEGNTLTLSETKVVLENGITIKGKTLKEHLEVVNHREAIEYLDELLLKEHTLSEYDIKSLHYLILKDIDSKNAGKYRDENIFISGAKHIPPNFLNVPLEMQKLISSYKKWINLHPIIRASYLHGEFVKIHPFIEGNGRTARLLLNFELMKNGYPPVVIKYKERAKYYDALDKAHTTNDYTDFIDLVAELVEETENDYLYLLNVDYKNIEKE